MWRRGYTWLYRRSSLHGVGAAICLRALQQSLTRHSVRRAEPAWGVLLRRWAEGWGGWTGVSCSVLGRCSGSSGGCRGNYVVVHAKEQLEKRYWEPYFRGRAGMRNYMFACHWAFSEGGQSATPMLELGDMEGFTGG